MVKTAESMAIETMRVLMLAAHQTEITRITVHVHDEVATYLNNRKRRELATLEDAGPVVIQILGHEGVSPEHLLFECVDVNGREVKLVD